jgi:uncharacterized membrane protein YjfL (UPF0719 family)
MPDIVLFASSVAVGFVAAAVLAAIYRGVTSQPVSFTTHRPGTMAMIAAFVFRVLVGPAIIVRQSVASAQSGDVPSSWAAAGVMVATVWSGCLGIAIIAIVGRLIA